MRLPYAPSHPPPTAPASTHDIYTRIADRRAPRPLIPLDLALLHSPAVADGWNSLLGAVRSGTTLHAAVSELAICRIAVLNGASWEWIAHAPLALRAGVEKGALRRVLAMPAVCERRGGLERQQGQEEHDDDDDDDGVFTQQQRAVLAYTDFMTRAIAVPDGVFAALSLPADGAEGGAGLDTRQVVELTATVAAYNCVSRFLVALDVGENNGREMRVPGEEAGS